MNPFRWLVSAEYRETQRELRKLDREYDYRVKHRAPGVSIHNIGFGMEGDANRRLAAIREKNKKTEDVS